MKTKSAVHGARAAAGQGEAAKTAANRPSAFVSHVPEYRHGAHWPGRCTQFEEAFMSVVNLTRYNPAEVRVGDQCRTDMVHDPLGDWVKFKEAVEALTSSLQLKAEIAACADQLELIPGTGYMVGKRMDILAKLRQLSAV